MLELAEFKLIDANFPHISSRLELLWGYKEFNSLINNLLMDSRDGARAGFPPEIAQALFRLSIIHLKRYPHLVDTNDIWEI